MTPRKPIALLLEAALQLGPDEIRVLTYIAGRLLHGKREYGPLQLATDKRDWRIELAQESADALVYAACEALRKG